MDPVLKIWLYQNWLGDHRDDSELAKNHAYLLGSFWNPEAVKEMMNDNIHESSDEDFQDSLEMVNSIDVRSLSPIQPEKSKRKRRRATLKE
jgi:hypothetical protein